MKSQAFFCYSFFVCRDGFSNQVHRGGFYYDTARNTERYEKGVGAVHKKGVAIPHNEVAHGVEERASRRQGDDTSGNEDRGGGLERPRQDAGV